MNIAIENGRVIDPKNAVDRNASLYIADGKVAGVGEAPAGFVAERTVDATRCVVCPGLIDLGARLNSIEAELAAAVAGGVTTVVVPPDAVPPLDEPELADRLIHRAKDIGKARVLPLGALTIGLQGERLAELAGLKKAGCIASVSYTHLDVYKRQPLPSPLPDAEIQCRQLAEQIRPHLHRQPALIGILSLIHI